MAIAAHLGLLRELEVHLLHTELKEVLEGLLVARLVQLDNISQHLEGKHLCRVVDGSEADRQSRRERGKFAAVLLEREADGGDLSPTDKEVAQVALILCQRLHLSLQKVQIIRRKYHHDLLLRPAAFFVVWLGLFNFCLLNDDLG